MQTGTGSLTEQSVVVAPSPERAKYDIEIPWLIRGENGHSRALETFETSALRILFHGFGSIQFDAPVDSDGRKVESGVRKAIHQGLPSDLFVSDIVEKIGKYTGIRDSNESVSRVILEYLEHRCFGQPVALNECSDTADLLRTGLSDYIARYLSREFIRARHDPKCVKFALSSTSPFAWMHDIPLIEASKTIFNYVATWNQYEREFAKFLDRCEDVLRFTSLGVNQRKSLVFQGQERLPYSSSILPCDPDWVVVHDYNGEVWNWIIGTKMHTHRDDLRNEFMATEWCEIATQSTGSCWQYILVDPRIGFEQFPSFQSLIVSESCRSIAALRAAQRAPTSIEEIIHLRDEGRP